MPGVLGGIAGAVSSSTNLADGVYSGDNKALVFSNYKDENFKPSDQAAMQLAALGVTLCMSIIPGLLIGLLLRSDFLFKKPAQFFTDSLYWILEEEESAEDDTKEKVKEVQMVSMKETKKESNYDQPKDSKRDSRRDYHDDDV